MSQALCEDVPRRGTEKCAVCSQCDTLRIVLSKLSFESKLQVIGNERTHFRKQIDPTRPRANEVSLSFKSRRVRGASSAPFRLRKTRGDFAGAAGVAGIVGVDSFHGFGDFAKRFEGEKAVVLSEDFRESGFLNDDGTAGREIATAPVAEPSRVETNVLILGHGEFAFRAPDVVPVTPVVRAQVVRRTKEPAVSLELSSRWRVLDVGRQLKRFS